MLTYSNDDGASLKGFSKEVTLLERPLQQSGKKLLEESDIVWCKLYCEKTGDCHLDIGWIVVILEEMETGC